jgi:hypothetical protein
VRPETQKIIAEVETRSGLPVQVIPMRDLPVVATVTMSPHATDSYVIRYRPGIAFKDYIVAFQCGHVLRALALPERQRVQFASTGEARSWAERLLRARLAATKKPTFPDAVIEPFAANLVDGLLTQLRSIPVGMRVDAWLAEEYPALADEQALSISLQQQEALVSLSPAVKEAVPDEIVAGSVLLNTAYALFCDRLLGTAEYQVPYVAAGFKELGGALLAIFDELPADPASDVALVDRWAQEIGLSGKYQWVSMAASAPTVS